MRKIIDNHFATNYEYYRKVCKAYYRGADLADDLLHESFVSFTKVKPDVIERFNELEKLHCIVLKIIRSTYANRRRAKQNKQGNTSPLYIGSSTSVDYEFVNLVSVEEDNVLLELEPKLLAVIKQAECEPVVYGKGKELSNFLKVKVFVQANQQGIRQTSRSTGISRNYLAKIYNEGKEFLKQQLNETYTTL
jgi:DNA-directed RNA polymerase specialized sigma24 family protein